MTERPLTLNSFVSPNAKQIASWKAGLLRGYRNVLDDRGWRDEVERHLPTRTLELLHDPPPVTQWLSAPYTMSIITAVARCQGLEAVNHLTKASTERGFMRFVGPVARRVMRVAGRSPEPLLKRIDLMVGLQAKGYEPSYQPVGPGRGEVLIRSHGIVENAATRQAWIGGIRSVIELSNIKATIMPRRTAEHGWGSVTEFDVSWES